MQPLTIRAAQPGDITELMAIEGDADQRFAETAHPELALGGTIPAEVFERAIKRDHLLVATQKDEVVGWILLTRSDGELCIGQVSVRRSAGRRGIGTTLLRHVIEAAAAAGEPSVVLNTQRDIPWNQAWYGGHGFVVVDRADWTDDMHVIAREQTDAGLDWNTRVHMRLTLEAAVAKPKAADLPIDGE